jgi:acyl-CoA thioesterase FadM
MNLIFRLLLTLFLSGRREPVSVLGPCLTPFRCWFTDLDILRHMNNGKYFSIMDLARVDLMIRADLYERLSQNGWYPVVVAETLRFRKSLKPLERFMVETVVLGWDEKAFILQQRFLRSEECVAEGVVRARILKRSGGSAVPAEVIALSGDVPTPPSLPDWVSAWNARQAE